MCISEEIVKRDIAKEIMNGNNDVLLEISKQFSKYAKENMNIDYFWMIYNLTTDRNALEIEICVENKNIV